MRGRQGEENNNKTQTENEFLIHWTNVQLGVVWHELITFVDWCERVGVKGEEVKGLDSVSISEEEEEEEEEEEKEEVEVEGVDEVGTQ